MLNWKDELSGIYFNTDWSDSPKVGLVVNQPEVGPPIVRLRSRTVEHLFTGSFDLTYQEYNYKFVPFVMKKLMGGTKQFLFPSLIDGHTYPANLVVEGGTPYKYKRKDTNLYTVSVTIHYYEVGAIADA